MLDGLGNEKSLVSRTLEYEINREKSLKGCFNEFSIYKKDIKKILEYKFVPQENIILKKELHFIQNMYDAASWLEKHNIVFKDFWTENITKKGNDFVLIDLGYSESPGNIEDIRETMKLKEVL